MKKSIFMPLLLTFCFLLHLTGRTEIVSSGYAGEDLSWFLSDDNVLTISGTGKALTNPQWLYWEDRNRIKKIIIEEGVEVITGFENQKSLTSVSLPDSISLMNGSVFSECIELVSINLPSKLESINDGLFYHCISLNSIIIPDNILSIGNGAFQGCTKLETITLPHNINALNPLAFAECSNLKNITFPESLGSIGDCCFRDCESLSSINIPSNIVSIEDATFQGCINLKNIVLPNGLTSIGYIAFSNCKSLEKIMIPDTVTKIGEEAFYNCSSLNQIILPASVTEIGPSAFSGCTSLKQVVIENSDALISEDAIGSNNSCELIIYGHENSTAEHYAVDHGLNFSVLCENHFIVHDSSLDPTCTEAGLTEGSHCLNCGLIIKAQKELLPLGHMWSLAGYKYDEQNQTITAEYVCLRNSTHFYSDHRLARLIYLPNNTRRIESCAFENTPIQAIMIPDTCIEIGSRAFANCMNLKYVRIPANAIVATGAFDGCDDVWIDQSHE